ncbi:hypothetical protein P9112_002695 [Eukaryota sp. TZLM1-RC]
MTEPDRVQSLLSRLQKSREDTTSTALTTTPRQSLKSPQMQSTKPYVPETSYSPSLNKDSQTSHHIVSVLKKTEPTSAQSPQDIAESIQKRRNKRQELRVNQENKHSAAQVTTFNQVEQVRAKEVYRFFEEQHQ